MSPQPGQDSPQHIIVSVDDSEGSRSALRWAAAEAEAHSAELECERSSAVGSLPS
jgi:hypothetical protein